MTNCVLIDIPLLFVFVVRVESPALLSIIFMYQ